MSMALSMDIAVAQTLGPTAFSGNGSFADLPIEQLVQPKYKTADPQPNPSSQNPDAAELDYELLGPWAFVSTAKQQLTEKSLTAALKKCIARPKIQKLDIERGAARKLPSTSLLFGDIVYFRTEKGMQRFDAKTGQITLIRAIRKTQTSSNKTVWALAGRVNSFRIRFSQANRRNKQVRFMLEEGGLYVGCKLRSEQATSVVAASGATQPNNPTFVPIGCVALAPGACTEVAQQSASDLEIQKAAIFQERLIRPWSLVIDVWNRKPTVTEWDDARLRCRRSGLRRDINAIEDAKAEPPARSELIGSLVYYSGSDGLRELDLINGEIRLYPDLRIARDSFGTTIFQIFGRAGQHAVAIGQMRTDKTIAVAMRRDKALYLSCRQPDNGSKSK